MRPMAVETTPVFSHYSMSLTVLRCSRLASVYPTGYSSEGQVKLEVLYSVQDTTVVLHRDWITYSKDAPCSLPQQSDMGASHSATGETVSPQNSPQDDHTPRRGDTLVTELLKECVQSEWVGSPSCAMVEALSASLQPLSLDNLARVDCEVAISLERGSLPRRVDTDNRREESPPTGGWGLTGGPTAPRGVVGWRRGGVTSVVCAVLQRRHFCMFWLSTGWCVLFSTWFNFLEQVKLQFDWTRVVECQRRLLRRKAIVSCHSF